MIFSVYYFAALILAGADFRGRLAAWKIRVAPLGAGVWCAVLVATYVVQLGIAFASAERSPWPIALLPPSPAHGDLLTAALLVLAALQVIALAGLYRAHIGNAVVVCGVVMLALSWFAPVFLNADIYAYVGNGVLGSGAYAPPGVPFLGDLALINLRWGTPVPAATYGPLWLVVAHLVVALASTLLAKVLAFRVLSLALFVALIALLRAYGLPARVLAITALNPGLQMQFVVDAHNDLLPIVLVVAAAVAVRRLPLAACALVVVAALVKLPYALVGLPVLAAIQPALRRYAACAAVVVASAALSWFGGGAAYAHSLLAYSAATGSAGIVHGIAALAAVIAILAAVAGARRLRGAVWLMPMLGPFTASWYAIWSLPYALGKRRVLSYLLLWFPAVSVLAEPSLARPWTMFFAVPVIVALSLRYSLQPRPS